MPRALPTAALALAAALLAGCGGAVPASSDQKLYRQKAAAVCEDDARKIEAVNAGGASSLARLTRAAAVVHATVRGLGAISPVPAPQQPGHRAIVVLARREAAVLDRAVARARGTGRVGAIQPFVARLDGLDRKLNLQFRLLGLSRCAAIGGM